MASARTIAGVFSLPGAEGSVAIMVPRARKEDWHRMLLTERFFLFHRHYCKGPLNLVRVSATLMVLYCPNCGMRISLVTPHDLPRTLGEVVEVLEDMKKIELGAGPVQR